MNGPFRSLASAKKFIERVWRKTEAELLECERQGLPSPPPKRRKRNRRRR